ncbi:MAG: hypothetical protein MZV70_44570 [Desulfobacterales bacterium]|nr:hypothetical protein [Desulfobacterales bacterium]
MDATLMAFRLAEDRAGPASGHGLPGRFHPFAHRGESGHARAGGGGRASCPSSSRTTCWTLPDPKVINIPSCLPEYAMEMRYQLDRAIDQSREVIAEVEADVRQGVRPFLRRADRHLPHGGRRVRHADPGDGDRHCPAGRWTSCGRRAGRPGLIKLRFMRPFPYEELWRRLPWTEGPGRLRPLRRRSTAAARCITEVRSRLLQRSDRRSPDHVAGIGGRDLTPGHMREMFDIVERASKVRRVRTVHLARSEGGDVNERDERSSRTCRPTTCSSAATGRAPAAAWPIAVKNIMRILGADTTVYVPASCLVVISAMYPTTNFRTPYLLHRLREHRGGHHRNTGGAEPPQG